MADLWLQQPIPIVRSLELRRLATLSEEWRRRLWLHMFVTLSRLDPKDVFVGGTLQLETLMLADAVSAHEGKVYLHGAGLTRINGPVPIGLPSFRSSRDLGLRRRTRAEATRSVSRCWTPQGEPMIPVQEADVAPIPRPHLAEREESYIHLVFTFAPVVFTIEGIHRVELAIDGELVGAMNLPVVSPARAIVRQP